jgi:carboxyl-terminal processing protease
MNRNALCVVFLAASVVGATGAGAGEGDEPAGRAIPEEVVRRAFAVVDVVLRSHVSPPSRQEMILSGIRALYRVQRAPEPSGLARRVSDATGPDQVAALMDAAWPRGKPVEESRDVLLEGLLGPVAGDARLMTDKEYNVEQQIGGNRYEGVHIQLSSEGEGKDRRTTIMGVVPGGPADRAGVKVQDAVEAVDDVDVIGRSLTEVVDKIRGPLGSTVTLTVRQPKADSARKLSMTRERLFVPTVTGLSKTPSGGCGIIIDGSDSIAYLHVGTINASTPHELRKVAEALDADPPRGVILDLRGPRDSDFHAAVLLADALLSSGVIGRLQTAERTTPYHADADQVFRGKPIAVLIDPATLGVDEWLVAALQDNGRAVVVGSPLERSPRMGRIWSRRGLGPESSWADRQFVFETVPVPEGAGWLKLAVGRLVRSGPQQQRPGLDELAIKPDVRIEVPDRNPLQVVRRTPFEKDEENQAIDPAKDPYISKAVEVLRDKAKNPEKADRPRESQ